MKQTFSHKIFDWVLIIITLIFSVLSFLNLFNGIEFFSSYLLNIVYTLISVIALFSLLLSQLNGERFSRFFIIVVLIIPAILILYQFLTDLVFYGANRLELLQSPILFIKLISGITLFYFAIKYSKQGKTERIKDYGILIIGIGVFAFCYVLTRTIEPYSNSEINNYPIWKTIVKSTIGIATIIFGARILKQKTRLSKGLLWTLIIMFIFGLI